MHATLEKRRRIVVGVDFSPASIAAARWSVAWLAANNEIILVHALVVPEMTGILAGRFPIPESLLENARAGAARRLQQLIATFKTDSIKSEIREGNPADVIADVARDFHADLVVVGKHGEGGPHRGYTGRTADRLVRSSPAAVLLANGMPAGAPSRIIVPLTYSSITPFIIEWVRRLQESSNAEVVGIHVVGSAVLSHVLTMSAIKHGEPLTAEKIDEVFAEDRDRWQHELVSAGIPREKVRAEVVFGEVSDAVVAAVRQWQADMVVMGSHAGPVRRLLLGSSASSVLRQADFPVLIAVEPETIETANPITADETERELVTV
jgi:nucleotide-binding universal stress UspA family protein